MGAACATKCSFMCGICRVNVCIGLPRIRGSNGRYTSEINSIHSIDQLRRLGVQKH